MTTRGLVVVALAAMLSSCLTCTDVGCGDEASWSRTLPMRDFHSMRVHACRNDVCASGTFPSSGFGNEVRLTPDVAGSTAIGGDADALDVSGSIRFDVRITGPRALLADGDVYSVQIHDASGALVVELAPTPVTYLANQPNGPTCGPTCLQATLP